MKPTISNAFNDDSASSADNESPSTGSSPNKEVNASDSWNLRKPQDIRSSKSNRPGNPRKSLAASLASMQVDLREADFGFSLELSPMQAVDAVQGIVASAAHVAEFDLPVAHPTAMYLISMEQSAWVDNQGNATISDIASRLAIPVIEQLEADLLVMDEIGLRQLISVCQPTRLLVIAIEGPIESGDAKAINKAVEMGRSPLLVELRAIWALEVIGDRSVVLHCRDRNNALALVAENFRHYLAALNSRPATQFAGPESWQVDRLLSMTGALTIRPIETQLFSTSIDVGINTSKDHVVQPADRSLIYDIPSNTWHDEP